MLINYSNLIYLKFTMYLFVLIIIFKYIIKYLFSKFKYSNTNTHSLFRSFFCLFISTGSMGICILNWDNLIQNPTGFNYYSSLINRLMFNYMLYDTIYFFYKKQYRLELLIHHLICAIIFGMYWDKFILTFCTINEILSGYNWIGLINNKFEWLTKLLKLYSLIFIRSGIWINTLFMLSKSKEYYQMGLIVIGIFVCLDLYWIGIILYNFFNSTKKNNKIKNNKIKNKK